MPIRSTSARGNVPLCMITFRDRSITSKMLAAHSTVGMYGTEAERTLLQDVMTAMDKARRDKDPAELERQMRLAQRLNITIPQTHYIGDAQSLERVCPILKFPVVLKPYRSMIWTNGRCTAASVPVRMPTSLSWASSIP